MVLRVGRRLVSAVPSLVLGCTQAVARRDEEGDLVEASQEEVEVGGWAQDHVKCDDGQDHHEYVNHRPFALGV